MTNVTVNGSQRLVVFGENSNSFSSCQSISGSSASPSVHAMSTNFTDIQRLKCVVGIWMNVAGDETNDFFTGLQPYIDATTGPVRVLLTSRSFLHLITRDHPFMQFT